MELSIGIDFSHDDVAKALIDYAKKNGAHITEGASEVAVLRTGSRLRRAGVFLVLRRNGAKKKPAATERTTP